MAKYVDGTRVGSGGRDWSLGELLWFRLLQGRMVLRGRNVVAIGARVVVVLLLLLLLQVVLLLLLEGGRQLLDDFAGDL